MNLIEQSKQEAGHTYRALCQAVDLPYRTLQRWRGRRQQGQPLIGRPGPKKLPPAAPGPMPTVEEIIRQCVRHGPRRSSGTGPAWERVRIWIPRHWFRERIRHDRMCQHRLERARMRRVRCHLPGAIWSMDETLLERWYPVRAHVLLIGDVASGYEFAPLWGEVVTAGEWLATHLEWLFDRHGAPVVLKRDHGSNLNHEAVNAVLARYGVLALNSPPYWPRYNGSRERGVRLFKDGLAHWLGSKPEATAVDLADGIELVRLCSNQRPRRRWAGLDPSSLLRSGQEIVRRYGQLERERAGQWVREEAERAGRLGLSPEETQKRSRKTVNALWRRAVETWLQNQKIITIIPGKSVTPCS